MLVTLVLPPRLPTSTTTEPGGQSVRGVRSWEGSDAGLFHDMEGERMSAPGAPNGAPAPNDQIPTHPSFRRQRASRACETCHARKVRCDAASLGVPCELSCKIHSPMLWRLTSQQARTASPSPSSARSQRPNERKLLANREIQTGRVPQSRRLRRG